MKAFYFPPYSDQSKRGYFPPPYPYYDPAAIPPEMYYPKDQKDFPRQPFYYPPPGYASDIGKDQARPPWAYQFPPMPGNYPPNPNPEIIPSDVYPSPPSESTKEKTAPSSKEPGMGTIKIRIRRLTWPNKRL